MTKIHSDNHHKNHNNIEVISNILINRKYQRKIMKIKSVEIGKNRCFTMAEVASAHCGNIETLKKIIKNTSETSVDAIKFQILNAEKLCADENPDLPILRTIELSQEQWKEIFAYTSQFDMIVFAEVFDTESAIFAKEYVDGLSVHAADLTNPFLIEIVASANKPLMLNVGGSSIEEIRTSISFVKEHGDENNLILMYGIQNFPTTISDINLNRIKTLEKEFPYIIGYHDHTEATDPMSLSINLAARAYGAKMIEKHVTDDRSKKGYDYISSLHKDELKELIFQIREFENCLGTAEISLSKADWVYRRRIKKFIVAKKDLKAGDVLTLSDLDYKRTQKEGFLPDEFNQLIGKKVAQDIKKDSLIDNNSIIG
jgi:sialic acid synthase SpsE